MIFLHLPNRLWQRLSSVYRNRRRPHPTRLRGGDERRVATNVSLMMLNVCVQREKGYMRRHQSIFLRLI